MISIGAGDVRRSKCLIGGPGLDIPRGGLLSPTAVNANSVDISKRPEKNRIGDESSEKAYGTEHKRVNEEQDDPKQLAVNEEPADPKGDIDAEDVANQKQEQARHGTQTHRNEKTESDVGVQRDVRHGE